MSYEKQIEQAEIDINTAWLSVSKLKSSRERSLCITKLEEAQMWLRKLRGEHKRNKG